MQTFSRGVPRSWIDIDALLTANSDSKIATQKAVKAYADAISAALVAAAIPSSWVDTDTALTANSDSKVATQKAIKAYADAVAAASIPASWVDIDDTLAANSDSKVPSQQAIKAYVDAINAALSGATFLSVASYAGDIQATLDAAAALPAVGTTKGAIVFIPPGEYTTAGLTYAPFVSIIGSGMSTLITMTGATGSVIGPELPAVATTHNIFANFYIDMANQGDCGLMLEAIQHGVVNNVKVFNIPNGTYTYNSVANIKRSGIALIGKNAISGAYYNTLNNCQCQGTSTGDRGECGIYLSGVATQPANHNRIVQPKVFHCVSAIEVAVGGDNKIEMPEVSICDVGIWFTGTSYRNEARHIYAETIALVPTRVDANALYSRIGPFANVVASTSKELFLVSSASVTDGETITVTGKDTSATVYGITQNYNDGQQYSIIVTNITGTAFAVGDVLDGTSSGADFATIKSIDVPLCADQTTTIRARASVDDRTVFGARGWLFGLRGIFAGHSFLSTAYDFPIDFEGAAGAGKALLFRTNNAANAMTERARLTSGVNAGSLTFATNACGLNMGTGANNNITLEGTWNGGHLLLGSYHLWVDETGDLRIKSSAPASHDDGTVVGAAYPVGIICNSNDDPATLLGVGTWFNLLSVFEGKLPPAYSTTYAKATSSTNATYYPHFCLNPSLSLTGGYANNQWTTDGGANTNIRFHVDLGSAQIISRLYYENSHDSGGNTDTGAKNFTLWGSNSAGSFAELTYGTDTGWTQITGLSASQFDQHVAADQADPKYITITGNLASYRYYALKIADGWGATLLGLRRLRIDAGFYSWLRTA